MLRLKSLISCQTKASEGGKNDNYLDNELSFHDYFALGFAAGVLAMAIASYVLSSILELIL